MLFILGTKQINDKNFKNIDRSSFWGGRGHTLFILLLNYLLLPNPKMYICTCVYSHSPFSPSHGLY